MKYSGLLCALVSAEPHLRQVRQAPDAERRYNQLTDMMSFYNPDFDERKYWTYGCNCLILGQNMINQNLINTKLKNLIL